MIALRPALVAFLCATVAIAGTVPESAAPPKVTDGLGLGEECHTFIGTQSNPRLRYRNMHLHLARRELWKGTTLFPVPMACSAASFLVKITMSKRTMFKYLAATLFAIVAIQSAVASPTSAPDINQQCGSASGIVACANDLKCCFIATNYGV
ncbi:hypothetical protein BD779DRAFT_1672734 [Infundibulicybe gibba]|nr:hypothetical protein BD779DRAFT_1672734 [Infundibulicybe gibba]